MLQSIKTQIGHPGRFGMSVDPEHAAFFAQLVVPKIIHSLRLSRIRVAFNQGFNLRRVWGRRCKPSPPLRCIVVFLVTLALWTPQELKPSTNHTKRKDLIRPISCDFVDRSARGIEHEPAGYLLQT